MKLALVGYGKMGRMIESLAAEYGAEVVLRLDEFNNPGQQAMTRENFAGIDVAIEFTTPATALPNIKRLCELGVTTVVGTTGWEAELAQVREQATAADIGFVWSFNYSIGVNLWFRMVHEAGRLLKEHPSYEAWAWEIHHSAKKDAPSGTLRMAVDAMRNAGYEHRIDESSSRAGAHPGTHEIGFDAGPDTITIRHTARSREGFARGALHAARAIHGRKGFFAFQELLFPETQS
jgi:4-hydroxy-tetrahydrodipicolinate reductase